MEDRGTLSIPYQSVSSMAETIETGDSEVRETTRSAHDSRTSDIFNKIYSMQKHQISVQHLRVQSYLPLKQHSKRPVVFARCLQIDF